MFGVYRCGGKRNPQIDENEWPPALLRSAIVRNKLGGGSTPFYPRALAKVAGAARNTITPKIASSPIIAHRETQ